MKSSLSQRNVLKVSHFCKIHSFSLLHSAVSSLSQCGLTKHTKINLECLIFTTTPHFSLFFPVWGFKDQRHSMWCFVYTVWCHHTNLARQFCPTASPFMEWRASSARFFSVSTSNCNPDNEKFHWNLYEHLDQGCRRNKAGTGALMLQIGQTEWYEKTKPLLQIDPLFKRVWQSD